MYKTKTRDITSFDLGTQECIVHSFDNGTEIARACIEYVESKLLRL